MGKSFFGLLILWISLEILFLACAPRSQEAIPQVSVQSVTPQPRSQWEELVANAKKEGSVNIYATAVAPVVSPLKQAFKQKFGITLDFTEGRPAEISAKLTAERRAGLYLADAGHLGETTSMMDMKPLGITLPIPDLLILSEVNNADNWIGGKLPFLDKDRHVFMFMAMAIPLGIANSNMVKEGEISSFLDIVKPQWKGKIVFSDPRISGTSPNLMAALVKTFGRERAMDIFKQLEAQEPIITRDQRLMLDWVAQGKYPVGLGQSMALFSEFRRAQAPVKILNLKEPRFISGGPGNLIVYGKNPHPKATQLYINWLLSKEGSSIWSQSLEYPSSRVDVSREGLNPDTLPRATDIFPDEEQMALRLEMRKASADIFGRLLR